MESYLGKSPRLLEVSPCALLEIFYLKGREGDSPMIYKNIMLREQGNKNILF
jgi:hypothetical protein